MIQEGSNIRITIGTRQVYGRVKTIWNKGPEPSMDHHVLYDARQPNFYWDMEYEIDNPAPGRGNIGRWKQNTDGGYVQLA